MLFFIGLLIVYLFLVSYFLFWIGNLIGGKGSFEEVRTAYICAFPPLFVASVFGILLDYSYWNKVWLGSLTLQDYSLPHMSGWQVIIKTLNYLFFSWHFILGIINVSVAHGFSI